MDYRPLGPTGAQVSTLCLGTMTFGEADEDSFMHKVGCDEETSWAIMNRALDAGINFFDTANIYGQDGLSERVIGRWFEKDQRRDEVVLATKFRFRMHPGPNGAGASRRHIVQAVEESLRRLKTDRIDLYQVHMQDKLTREEETLRALDDLVRSGKVLYIGASNYAAYRLVESLGISAHQGLSSYATIQMQYSLAVRDIEREHIPACKRWGLGVLPWSPLAAGFLTGKYEPGAEGDSDHRLGATERWKTRLGAFDTERNWKIVETLKDIAGALSTSPAAVALRWLVQKPQVTSVIFGARSLTQLDANLEASRITLDRSQMNRLDEVSALKIGYPYNFIKQVDGRW
jgi:aryl-alcohol dehydrogenase-like predicted oxidoreductase